MEEEKADLKCPKCKTYRYPREFLNTKNRTLKTCIQCRERATKYRNEKKCEHGRQRNKCKDCGGSQICFHGRRRNQCKDCGGVSICEHERRKDQCKDCGGSQICFHERQKAQCKDCMDDEQKIEYIKKTMIRSSKQKDKKYDRYDADKFIDMCFLTELFEECDSCYYCSVEFTYNEKCDTLVTIERLNNNVGHTKSNCVLACWGCNMKHKGKNDVRK